MMTKVTILPYRGPRKSERTWPMIRGSVSSVGAKAVALSQHGITKKKHG
jgi:hypothetical protein